MQLSSSDFEYINTYTDSVLENLHDQMVEGGLQTINLPDTTVDFSKRRLGVTWKGEAVLYKGTLKGLETIHRAGESTITINVRQLSLSPYLIKYKTYLHNWS